MRAQRILHVCAACTKQIECKSARAYSKNTQLNVIAQADILSTVDSRYDISAWPWYRLTDISVEL